MDKLGAEFSTKDLDSTVGNNFIGIHVALSARSSLPDDEREMVVEFALRYLIGSLNNSISNLGLESKANVSLSSCLLEETESTNNWERHALTLTTYLEVLAGALSLCTPILVTWDFNRPEGVCLLTVLAWGEDSETADLLCETE
jgi:hypothetical protein